MPNKMAALLLLFPVCFNASRIRFFSVASSCRLNVCGPADLLEKLTGFHVVFYLFCHNRNFFNPTELIK